MFKLGLTAMYGMGLDAIRDIDWQKPLFLDAKLHDIPAQVEGAVGALRSIGASFVTVHSGGGREMVRAAVDAAEDELAILAVTVLTSLGAADLARAGWALSTADAVTKLAEVAVGAGADGLVCSAHEVEELRARFGPRSDGGPILVVPGIRPAGSSADDQRRTMTPREALERGADLLVIGRPISAAGDAGAAARAIREELAA